MGFCSADCSEAELEGLAGLGANDAATTMGILSEMPASTTAGAGEEDGDADGAADGLADADGDGVRDIETPGSRDGVEDGEGDALVEGDGLADVVVWTIWHTPPLTLAYPTGHNTHWFPGPFPYPTSPLHDAEHVVCAAFT